MERTRSSWTDERLDDLSRRVESGFSRVDQDLRSLRTDVDARFDSMRAEMNARFDSQQRTTLQVGAAIMTANLIAIITAFAAG